MADSSGALPPESYLASRMARGFRAQLQGMSLHDLVRLQHLTRASGVYLVLSNDRSGVLHFEQGTLFHAELSDGEANVAGNLAAVEIVSWLDGEFLTSTQRLAERATVSLSLDALLGPPEARADVSRATTTGIRRPLPSRAADSISDVGHAAAASSTGAVALAAAATPGTALTTPGLMARAGEPRSQVQVLVSPRGDLIDGRGPGADSLAPRVAYVARLAELIGQAMGAGGAHGLRVRGPSGELEVRRHGDGHIAGSFCPVDAGEATNVMSGLPSSPADTPPLTPSSAGRPQPRGSRWPSS